VRFEARSYNLLAESALIDDEAAHFRPEFDNPRSQGLLEFPEAREPTDATVERIAKVDECTGAIAKQHVQVPFELLQRCLTPDMVSYEDVVRILGDQEVKASSDGGL